MSNSFFVFEGIDGSGKTTQIELLEKRLQKKGYEVLRIREPGGTELSEEIRTLLLKNRTTPLNDYAELLLFNAARAQLIEEESSPPSPKGRWSLGDRFAWSTLAYQGYGRVWIANPFNKFSILYTFWPTQTFVGP